MGECAIEPFRFANSPIHQLARAHRGGEGRIRTSEAARATDLQSAAFDRSATSPCKPMVCILDSRSTYPAGPDVLPSSTCLRRDREACAKAQLPGDLFGSSDGAGGGI